MGSATRVALTAAREALAGIGALDQTTALEETGEQLLSAGRVIGESAPLLSALVDSTSATADRVSIVDAVFSGYTPSARKLLAAVASSRWSNGDDLLAGVEQLGFRVLAKSAPATVSIEDELFGFRSAVASDSELELAVSSKLGTGEAKAALVRRLLGAKVSPQSLAILEHLVQQPRGRRINELLSDAASAVADERGLAIATVTTAGAIAPAQLDRLTKALSTTYGRGIHIDHVIDPDVVGGLRVQIGDDVIDGTIASRLHDLRLQLAS